MQLRTIVAADKVAICVLLQESKDWPLEPLLLTHSQICYCQIYHTATILWETEQLNLREGQQHLDYHGLKSVLFVGRAKKMYMRE